MKSPNRGRTLLPPVLLLAIALTAGGADARSVSALTDKDYALLLAELDLRRADDLRRWAHVTGIPIVAVAKGREFFRANAHLLADTETAANLSTYELNDFSSKYDRNSGELSLRAGDGRVLPLRDIGSTAVRTLSLSGQVRHNPGFAEDRTDLEALGPYLIRLEAIPYLDEVRDAIVSLPWPVVEMLRGKAIYLTAEQGRSEAVWHCVSSSLAPEYAGMQPGVFVAEEPDGLTADALVRGLGRVLRETVLESQYFGLYAYPLQFPEIQALQRDRMQVFGRRRDRLPLTEHGYVTERARTDAQENFVEHFLAFVRNRGAFLARAEVEEAQGHPELIEKYRFMESMVERTSTTAERLTTQHIARVDTGRQREILEEYLTRQGQREVVVERLRREYGKAFSEFTETDYARFMEKLDLNRDDDLWSWSHFTGIPIAALGKRSITFHKNTHLLADAEAANLLSYAAVKKIESTYDAKTDRVQLTDTGGRRLQLRELPGGMIQRTSVTGSVVHSRGFALDRIAYEALEPYLVALEELENREEIGEGIRMLPLSIVKAHRGKALYPTALSRTGWGVTWRVSNDRNVSYVGMVSGSFVERRRDPPRAPIPPAELVAAGVDSLRGSAADSLVHEVGHIIDHAVIGGRPDTRSFPYQFPEFQRLLAEKNLVFGAGDSPVPQTSYGYVSHYAMTNAQENFAESFWAYLRDREGFRERALSEESEGHPELMQKYRFMEKLIDRTLPASERLSVAYLQEKAMEKVRTESTAEAQRREDAEEILAEYLAQEAKKAAQTADAEKTFGKPFPEFTRDDYARFMEGLDLDRDEDLWRWSHVTDIPILAVRKNSSFFYVNLHLLEDEAQAERLRRSRPTLEFDPKSGEIEMRSAEGETLAIRELPAGLIRKTERTGGTWYLENFGDDRIVHEALGPYLVRLRDLEYRHAIGSFIRSLPLSVVQVFRGKGVYFTTVTGRSYAVGMPCSNTTYKVFVGLETGVFVDPRNDGPAGTLANFVHEFGHLIDYVVMQGGYGSHLHSLQFPEFRKAVPEKESVFGIGDDPVPQTPFGYISRYAMTNAQENFAEHFRAFVLEKETFSDLARKEEAQGQPELMAKYRFMERLIERTPTSLRRLSAKVLEQEAAWEEQSDRLTRFYRAQTLLGEDAPVSLTRLIDGTLEAAFRDPRERSAESDRKVFDKALRDVKSIRDHDGTDAALDLLLGETLDVGFDRDATTEPAGPDGED